MKKIFITGCAKTGTTLVRRLFNAFDLKVYNKNEISLNSFISTEHNVGKRTVFDIFSNSMSNKDINRNLKLIKDNDIIIVNVIRNKEDVLKSTNGYVSEKRYDDSIKQSNKYNDIISYTIKYEDLIENPNKVQEDLSKKLNLTIIHKWSDYPSFINVEEENFKNKNYSLRPIGQSYKEKK